jgi:BTB/POZ domain
MLTIKLKRSAYMIDKAILLAKSNYFKALLEGPLGKDVGSDGVIKIEGNDN